jgi:integral membrane sensor domain MASE1
VAYYLGAEAAFLIGTLSDKIFAPFWPPNPILFCALVFVPQRQWPRYILAVLPAHVLAELGVGMGWLQLLVAFATNSMVAVLSAFGLRYLLGAPPWFNSLNRAVSYVLIAAIAAPAISALGGAFVRITGGGSFENYGAFWIEWYLANALGSLTLGAMLLTWIESNHDWSEFRSPSRRLEGALLLAGLAAACAMAFKAHPLTKACYIPSLLYLPLPFVVWAAVRFQALGATAAICVITVGSIASTLHGSTVFGGSEVEENVLALQLFLMVVSVSTLLLGASTAELRAAECTSARVARSVLGAQDDERRHIARRLLDDIGQTLAMATWATPQQPAPAGLEETVHKSIRDLRELSYLLHPPMLEDAGLEAALRARLQSFSDCTGIAVTFEASGLGRLSADLELTIYRVVEEALAHVKQHSASVAARVDVQRGAAGREDVVVSVEDAGARLPWRASVGGIFHRLTATASGWGLGLTRMRERVRRMGGTLVITTASSRTIVRALIPVAGQDAQRIV